MTKTKETNPQSEEQGPKKIYQKPKITKVELPVDDNDLTKVQAGSY